MLYKDRNCRQSIGIWIRRRMIGKRDWNASGERRTVRCADCQSMVPDLTLAADGMNKRRTCRVSFTAASARIKLRRALNSSTLFWRERYRSILMRVNTSRKTSVVSLMGFDESFRVLLFAIGAQMRTQPPLLTEKVTSDVALILYLTVGIVQLWRFDSQ